MTPETRLTQPFTGYAIEQLRTRFLYAVTTSHEVVSSAKVATQMSFQTELRAVLVKLTTPAPSTLSAVYPTRRRFLDVDIDMRLNKFLIDPALDDLLPLNVPEPYVNLLRRHLNSDYPRYRVCALAAALVLAASQS